MVDNNESQGKIVVLSKSPFEILDEAERNTLQNLKSLNRTLGLTGRLTTHLNDLFTRAQEPHVLAMKLAYCCGDFNSCRTKSLAFFIVSKINDLMKTKTIVAPNDPEIKINALSLILEQKNVTFRDLVIEAFDMQAHSECFIPFIRNLAKKKMFKDACQVAQTLNLFDHFTFEDFIIPLCLQEKEPVVESYLRKDKKSLRAFLKLMDSLLVDDAYVDYFNEIVTRCDIPLAKTFNSRGLCRFLTRIVKSSNEQDIVCPNLILRNLRGTMRYYLAKRFESNSPVTEGWSEMMLEVVGDRKNLQRELVEALYERAQFDEAIKWARKFNLPEDQLPPTLLEYQNENTSEIQVAVSEQPTANVVEFYTLPRDDMITVVEDECNFNSFLTSITAAKVVGFDTEWKPSFTYVENDVSLLQVATNDRIFILDRISLVKNVTDFSTQLVEKLFNNKDILKIGFSVTGDVKLLKSCFPELKEIRSLLDLSDLRTVLTAVHKFQFPCAVDNGEAGGKLLDLVQLTLGKTLDKTEQCSNWEKRPLRASQILYAAIDAYCLLEIYNVLSNECQKQGIAFKDVIQELQIGYSSSPKREIKPIAVPVAVSVKDFRMICTWELCRLVKRLRSCGIDASYNNARWPTKRTMRLMKRGFVVLTTIEQSWLRGVRTLRVPVADEKTQLLHVLNNYEIKVTDSDIFSRCPDCNKTDFMKLSETDLQALRARHTALSNNYNNAPPPGIDDEENSLEDIEEEEDDYDEYDAPQIRNETSETINYWTSKGKPILAEKVPEEIVGKCNTFTVCEWCGVVLWPLSFENLFLYN